jgi:hypothetical protein
MFDHQNADEGIVVQIPTLIKSHFAAGGRRVVEVQASSETVDFDGDCILQKALLGSASSFIARGHLDIDHISELGARYGIPNPESYIVGKPLEVKDIGGGNTSVVGEIARNVRPVHTSRKSQDDFWDSLQPGSTVKWLSSVYGYPTDMVDCRDVQCTDNYGEDIRRFLIKGFDWRSLAFTETPKNTQLKNAARVLTAKSFVENMLKQRDAAVAKAKPKSMVDLETMRTCPSCGVETYPTTIGYRTHFEKCLGFEPGESEIYAHAAMHSLRKSQILRKVDLVKN